MKIYKVRIKSTVYQYAIAIAFFICFLLLIPKNFFGYWPYMIFGITALGIGIWIGARLTRGLIEIEIDNSVFKLNWIEKPLLTTLESREIKFDDITGWRYRKEHSYHYFSIYTVYKNDLIFFRDAIWDKDKDDFGKFLSAFRNRVRNKNHQESVKRRHDSKDSYNEKSKQIVDREASYQKSIKGKLELYVYIASMMFGIYGLITKWEELGYRRGFLIGLLGICLGLIIDQLNKRKNSS